jgi:hypothetical protein
MLTAGLARVRQGAVHSDVVEADPALSPDWDTIAHDVVTNPFGSLSAIVDNLPLASSDINLLIELAIVETALATAVLKPTAASRHNWARRQRRSRRTWQSWFSRPPSTGLADLGTMLFDPAAIS